MGFILKEFRDEVGHIESAALQHGLKTKVRKASRVALKSIKDTSGSDIATAGFVRLPDDQEHLSLHFAVHCGGDRSVDDHE